MSIVSTPLLSFNHKSGLQMQLLFIHFVAYLKVKIMVKTIINHCLKHIKQYFTVMSILQFIVQIIKWICNLEYIADLPREISARTTDKNSVLVNHINDNSQLAFLLALGAENYSTNLYKFFVRHLLSENTLQTLSKNCNRSIFHFALLLFNMQRTDYFILQAMGFGY